MFSPILHSATRRSVAIAIGCAIIVFFIGTLAFAQQPVYVVAGHDDSTLYGYDLSTSTLLGSVGAGYHPYWVAVGPNPRLIFSGCVYYVSVVDVTIGREIKRIYGVYPSVGTAAFSSDGRWLLFADSGNYTLDVVDIAALKLVRTIRLAGAMGAGIYDPGSVVVVGHKAYVTTAFTDTGRPSIAVVDLRTFAVRRIATPTGYFDGSFYSSPNAAATADGKYVVIAQTDYFDGSYHLLFIDTRTDRLAQDEVIANDPLGLVISSVASPAYGYLIGVDTSGNYSATAIDLNPGSPTFGQLLSQTDVNLSQIGGFPPSAAISGDGSMLVVTGWKSSTQGPQPNALVVSTSLMFTDPSHAVVGQATVGNGERTGGVTVATVNVTPPPTAPTVTGVSGSVTNDAATTIHMTGTNFLAGAKVRIGNMVPLPATVNSSTDLQVTVPKHAPAGPNQDVIVTNPQITSPPAQQNQSGLLAGGLTIVLNPAFRPNYQFATLDYGDDTLSIYDFNQRAMVQPALSSPAVYGVLFNFDGAELYSGSLAAFWHRVAQMLAIDLGTDTVEATIPTPGAFGSYNTMALTVNPANGSPVIDFAGRSSDGRDLVVNMVDTSPLSPTFNTVIRTISAGLGQPPEALSAAAMPDGKYVYVNFYNLSTGVYEIAIFDVVHGNATIIDTGTLGVQGTQFQTYVTPDGQSLLLLGISPYSGPIAVFDIGTNPTSPTLVTAIAGNPPPQPGGPSAYYFYGYQVVGTHLFAYSINAVVVFNFNRSTHNFSQLSSYSLANTGLVSGGGSPFFVVSPDGAQVYVQPGGEDEITVLDGNALLTGQPPLLTKLAAGRRPWQLAMNPVAHSSKQTASAPIDGTASGQSGNHPAGVSQPPARERLQSGRDEREHSANSQ